MKNTTSPCDEGRLLVLLEGDERTVEFRAVAEHLELCSSCQARLAELAASHDEWTEAKRSLTLDEADSQIEREQEERSWSAAGNRRPPKTWTDSMTRQLLSPPSHPEMLGRLGRYEVERLIGSGGMGVVFKAFDSELNRPVAIKVLAPHLAGSGAARKRFSREARAAAAIVHEQVVAIHNVESESEPPFLVMPFVAGESLQGRIDREGPFSVCEILRIARQTAAGLAAAHQQGVIHRDVKPSNILLEEGVERALLTDFGLARASDDASLTHSGYIPGTPHYMSPEQARGENTDQRSDLFSLGSVMYTMCTGRTPFRAETSYGVLRRITDTHPRSIQEINPEIPRWLCCIVEKLHAKSPDERYESAAELAELLGQCLAHVQQPNVQLLPESLVVKTRSVSEATVGRLWKAILQNPRATVVSCVVSIVVLIASIIIIQNGPNDEGPTVDKQRRATSGSHQANTNTSTDVDPATDWDSAEIEVQKLKQQSDELSSRIDRLWDDMPAIPQPQNNLNQLSDSDQFDKEPVE